MTTGLVIREGCIEDASSLRELGVAGWETTYADFLRAENRRAYLSGPFWSIERLQAVIAARNCATFIAEIDDQCVGFLTLEPHANSATELTRFYVDPNTRGHGIGSSLWQTALTHLRDSGGRSVLVNVFGDNVNGRRFYERLGFVLIEETTTTVGDQTVPDVWYRLTFM